MDGLRDRHPLPADFGDRLERRGRAGAWPNDEALPVFNNEILFWSVIADLL